jgi:predicted glycosyltransferase
MIAFLTQYLYGLGHSNRIKLIAEETSKYTDVVIINQLFKPPLDFNVPQVSFLEDTQPPDGRSISGYVMNENLKNYRIKRFIETLDTYKIKVLVSEGFPFCRHQYADELFKCFEECKKRGIKIVVSIRDFPWDDPHEDQLKDWVNLTQNLICKYYVDKILVHGDPNILPLYSDRTKHTHPTQIIEQIKNQIIYTGYVCDNSAKPHETKNNIIYVSTGLNKQEGMLLFKEITKIASDFPDYKFVMPVANRYLKTGKSVRDNMVFVEYIPNLGKKIQSCAAFITYGGYNSTMEILVSGVPSIVVPRQDGHKLEQFVRAYAFEPYGFFKVLNNKEFNKLSKTLKQVLSSKPNTFNFDLKGAERSSDEIFRVYKTIT